MPELRKPQREPLVRRTERGRWDRMGAVEQFDYVVGLEAEVRRLRQGLWDVAAAAGADTDGDKTPDHMTYPDIVDYALQEVRELRETYAFDAEVPLREMGESNERLRGALLEIASEHPDPVELARRLLRNGA